MFSIFKCRFNLKEMYSFKVFKVYIVVCFMVFVLLWILIFFIFCVIILFFNNIICVLKKRKKSKNYVWNIYIYISICVREIICKEVLGLEYIRKGILKKINRVKRIEL